jgi:hypothetical protein
MLEPMHIVGVDLGQQRDYTAITVVERGYVPAGEMYNDEYYHRGKLIHAARQPVRLEYRVRHLERPALGTSYVEVVRGVLELLKRLGGEDAALAVDCTGVGRPVADLLEARLKEWLDGMEERSTYALNACWITITGGDSVTRTEGGMRVPKRDLISAPLVLMQNEQLKIAEGLRLRETLVKELLNFKVKINISTAHDSYEAWREGDHDDLVLAVAMACWCGERYLRKEDSIPRPGEWALAGVPVTVVGRRSA